MIFGSIFNIYRGTPILPPFKPILTDIILPPTPFTTDTIYHRHHFNILLQNGFEVDL